MKALTLVLSVVALLAAFPAYGQEVSVEDQIKGSIETEETTETSTGNSSLTDAPRQKGKVHYFASVGYALPVIDLSETNGSLPIRIGAQYFIIEGLALGLRFVFSPCFVEGSTTMFIFNLQPEILYMFKFGLDVYFDIGLMSLSTRTPNPIPGGDDIADTVAAAGLALGVSYNLFFNRRFSLEIGAEFDFNFKTDEDVLYPLLFLGGRFAMGPTGK